MHYIQEKKYFIKVCTCLLLQAEATAKSSELAALEQALSEAHTESGQQREEREKIEEALNGTAETLKQQLEEVSGEKKQAQNQLKQLSQEAKDSLMKMEVSSPKLPTCISHSTETTHT